jgi:hypothetical protein
MNIRPLTRWRAGALLAALAIIAALPQTVAASTRTEIKKLVVEEALATNVPPSLAMAVAKVESDFQARAISPKGARGVMQIMPANAYHEFGVDADELWNARLNIQLGIDLLERLIARYDGRWDLALSHYNGGSVAGSSSNARVLPSTQKYVQTVLQWQRRYANQSTVWQVYRAEKEGWIPSRTKVFDGRRIVSSRWLDAMGRTQTQVGSVGVARMADTGQNNRPKFRTLDDFTPELERRRAKARLTLDDFAKGWNGT